MDKVLKLNKTGEVKLIDEIKKSLSLKIDDELFVFSGKDCLVIKKVQKPSLAERFKNLSQKVERRFKKDGLGEEVIDEAVEWARK